MQSKKKVKYTSKRHSYSKTLKQPLIKMDRNFKHSKGGYGILPTAMLYNINRK